METTIKQSLLAGILVGIGVVANATSPNKYMGTLLFSVALLAIVQCEMQLYTGKIGYYKQYKKLSLGVMIYIIVNFSWMNFLKFLSVVIGNTFGAILARQLMVN